MTDLPNGYYAIPDPMNPDTMTYWRIKDGRARTWPSGAKYGPKFLRKDAPSKDDRDAYIAYIERCRAELGAWMLGVRAALTVEADDARARFAVLTTRCCICGRVLTDPATKVGGIGPECRVGIPDGVLAAIADSVATAHAEADR